MHYWRILGVAFITALFLVVTLPARAGKPTALDLAVAQVQDRTGGRILKAGPVHDKNGQLLLRIKVLLPDGRIKVFWIPPDQG